MEEALEQKFDISSRVEMVSEKLTENGLVISRCSGGDAARSAAAKIYRDAPAPASCASALAESGVAALLINANEELDGLEMKCNSNAPQIVGTKHAKTCRAGDCNLHLSGVSSHLNIARMRLASASSASFAGAPSAQPSSRCVSSGELAARSNLALMRAKGSAEGAKAASQSRAAFLNVDTTKGAVLLSTLASPIAICTALGTVVTDAALATEIGVEPHRVPHRVRRSRASARASAEFRANAAQAVPCDGESKKNPARGALGSPRVNDTPPWTPSLCSILLNASQPSASLGWKETAGVFARSASARSNNCENTACKFTLYLWQLRSKQATSVSAAAARRPKPLARTPACERASPATRSALLEC